MYNTDGTLNKAMVTILLIAIVASGLFCATAAKAEQVFLPLVQGGTGAWQEASNSPIIGDDATYVTYLDVYDLAHYDIPLAFEVPEADEWCDDPDAWVTDIVRYYDELDMCERDILRGWRFLAGGRTVVSVDYESIRVTDWGWSNATIVVAEYDCVVNGDMEGCSLRQYPIHVAWTHKFYQSDLPVFLNWDEQGFGTIPPLP